MSYQRQQISTAKGKKKELRMSNISETEKRGKDREEGKGRREKKKSMARNLFNKVKAKKKEKHLGLRCMEKKCLCAVEKARERKGIKKKKIT
jgi:hypothetical protein